MQSTSGWTACHLTNIQLEVFSGMHQCWRIRQALTLQPPEPPTPPTQVAQITTLVIQAVPSWSTQVSGSARIIPDPRDTRVEVRPGYFWAPGISCPFLIFLHFNNFE